MPADRRWPRRSSIGWRPRAGRTPFPRGTKPADEVQPEVIALMREVGFDLRGARPRRFTEELAAASQLLVTMGCGEACPVVPGLTRDDWPIEDPKGLPLDRVRRIGDEIHERVDRLVAAEGWATEAVVASP